MLKYFGYRFQHIGQIEMNVLVIVPFILYVSKSKIKKPEKKTGGMVYTVHITPWIAIGLAFPFKGE